MVKGEGEIRVDFFWNVVIKMFVEIGFLGGEERKGWIDVFELRGELVWERLFWLKG